MKTLEEIYQRQIEIRKKIFLGKVNIIKNNTNHANSIKNIIRTHKTEKIQKAKKQKKKEKRLNEKNRDKTIQVQYKNLMQYLNQKNI